MRRLAVLLAGVLVVGWGSSACTRCEIDCSATSRVEEVVARVNSIDPGIAHVITEDGDRIDVRILGGSVDDLERGRTYRFPLHHVEPEPPATTTTLDPAAAVPQTFPPGSPEAEFVEGLEDLLDGSADREPLEPAAFFPDDCDCTAQYISDVDGNVIDPGVDIPFRRYALAFLALSMLGAMGWALARWQKGEPI